MRIHGNCVPCPLTMVMLKLSAFAGAATPRPAAMTAESVLILRNMVLLPPERLFWREMCHEKGVRTLFAQKGPGVLLLKSSSTDSALMRSAHQHARAQVEEELFYPTVRRAIKDEELMNEAEVEHDSAKLLIRQLTSRKKNRISFPRRVGRRASAGAT